MEENNPNSDSEKHDSDGNNSEDTIAKIGRAAGGDPQLATALLRQSSIAMESGTHGPWDKHIDRSHVKQVLDTAKQHDQNQYKLVDDRDIREHGSAKFRHICALAALTLIVVVVVVIVFKDNPEAVTPMLTYFGVFVAGGFGGFGVSKVKK